MVSEARERVGVKSKRKRKKKMEQKRREMMGEGGAGEEEDFGLIEANNLLLLHYPIQS